VGQELVATLGLLDLLQFRDIVPKGNGAADLTVFMKSRGICRNDAVDSIGGLDRVKIAGRNATVSNYAGQGFCLSFALDVRQQTVQRHSTRVGPIVDQDMISPGNGERFHTVCPFENDVGKIMKQEASLSSAVNIMYEFAYRPGRRPQTVHPVVIYGRMPLRSVMRAPKVDCPDLFLSGIQFASQARSH
jgi:hypothetical protein